MSVRLSIKHYQQVVNLAERKRWLIGSGRPNLSEALRRMIVAGLESIAMQKETVAITDLQEIET